ncbi:hypothetical protein BJX65DRAFT_287145 [Aspergillus insuetus]
MLITTMKQSWYLYIYVAVWVGVVYLDSTDDGIRCGASSGAEDTVSWGPRAMKHLLVLCPLKQGHCSCMQVPS